MHTIVAFLLRLYLRYPCLDLAQSNCDLSDESQKETSPECSIPLHPTGHPQDLIAARDRVDVLKGKVEEAAQRLSSVMSKLTIMLDHFALWDSSCM